MIKKVGKCCACAVNGSCKRCSCSVKGIPCNGCVPSKYNRCANTIRSHDVQKSVDNKADKSNVPSNINNNNNNNASDIRGRVSEQWQDRFVNGFGHGLLCSDGEISLDKWHVWWKQLVLSYGSLYDLPNGNVGKKFTSILADEIVNLSEKKVTSERFIVFCRVILQRDNGVRKGSDVRRLVQRRLDLWSNGNFEELVQEAIRCCSQGKRRYKKGNDEGDSDHVNKVFTRLMWRGEVRAAARWINGKMSGNLLCPNDIIPGVCGDKTVIDVLEEKHPVPGKVDDDVLINGELPCLVDVDITGGHIERLSRSLHGGAGPGGTTSEHWRSFLLYHGTHSAKLREAIASLTRLLANEVVDWVLIRALMSSRLIALNKNPGVRPIGVGEVLRRLLGKAMVLTTGVDVEELCGADQLCSGLKGGIEGAIHSVNRLFNMSSSSGGCVLMVDAKNAFNSVNRVTGLWSARHLWPRCSRYLFNTYRGYSSLWVNGHPDSLLSREGVTQGDPLSMCFYAVALMPLVMKLKSLDWTQTWYADDSACTGSLPDVKRWFELLMKEGPKYGYHPEPSKSILVVGNQFKDQAKLLFGSFGVKIVSGSRFLGGYVGDDEGCEDFVKLKVNEWVASIGRLVEVSRSQPQAAFAVLVKSIQHEWAFLQRVVSVSSDWFDRLRGVLRSEFWSCLFGSQVSGIEADLFSLPTRLGGMGVRDPTLSTELFFELSSSGSSTIVDYLMGSQKMFSVADHSEVFVQACNERRIRQRVIDMDCLDRVLGSLDELKVRAVRRAIDGKCSNWLNVTPVSRFGFTLSEREFRDAIALRYRRPVVDMPSHCDGCDMPTTVSHALSCRKGGLIIKRHNEIRDSLGDMMAMGFSNVIKEPIICEGDLDGDRPGLIADLAVRGLWQPQTTALFDVRVVDTDAASYRHRPVQQVIGAAEEEKKAKYSSAIEDRRGSFTPFVLSVDGYMGREADRSLRRLADVLVWKWEKRYSKVIDWVRAYMAFSVIRATNLCLRGSRTKWRAVTHGPGFEDGGGLPYC